MAYFSINDPDLFIQSPSRKCMSKVYYFAYGSNLDPSQMKDRVGEWISSERVRAEGYKLVFNVKSGRWGGWAANLKKTDFIDDKSYGVVYGISNQQLIKMTGYEGGIDPISISVKKENNQEQKNVKAYIWPKEEPSHEPPEAYKKAIITGLKQHGYDQEIIEKVQKEFYQ